VEGRASFGTMSCVMGAGVFAEFEASAGDSAVVLIQPSTNSPSCDAFLNTHTHTRTHNTLTFLDVIAQLVRGG
jgi:hypothetical protein